MGEEVAAKAFTREDRQRYREKVHACLDAFARMLSQSRFDGDRASIGMEVELGQLALVVPLALAIAAVGIYRFPAPAMAAEIV